MSVTILIGDVFARLAELADDSVDVVVTSPPYWGLRDYGVEGQIGMEATLAEHLAVMVAVFREIRRVLKSTGICWVNYGDCYATTPNGRSAADSKATGLDDRTFRDKPMSTIGAGIKAKDLIMIPNRLAIALCDDGWYVRAECIWGKPNAMPDSSGSQRPAIAHEKVFMFTKSADADVWRARDTGELSFAPDLTERCPLVTDPKRTATRWLRIGSYYDALAVLQGRTSDEDANGYRGGSYVGGEPGPRATKGNKHVRGRETHGRHTLGEAIPLAQCRAGVDPRHTNHTGIADVERGYGRYLRNFEPAPLTVWEIAIEPFKGAHFATFPTELVRRCLAAGCPKGGMVLDPFGGAGTTALVANRMGFDATIIELNEEYAAIAARRLKADLALVSGADASRGLEPLPLFADRAGEAAA